MVPFSHRVAGRISLIYFAAAALWILASDTLLAAVVAEPDLRTTISVYKGMGFVVLTTSLLFLVVRRPLANVEREAAQRMRAENARAALDARFRGYVEHAPGGIFVTNDDGAFVDANPAALEMLCETRAGLLSKTVADIVAPAHRALAEEAFARFQNTGRARVELQVVRTDGTTFWVEVVAVGLASGEFMAYCQDISARRRALGEIDRLNRTYATLSRVNAAAARATAPLPLFQAVCTLAADVAGFPLVWIGRLAADGRQIVPVAQAGAATAYLHEVGLDIDVGGGPAARALREGHTVHVDELPAAARGEPWYQTGLRHGLRGAVAFPLLEDERVVACLVVHLGEGEPPAPGELELLADAAGSVSFAISGLARAQAQRQAEQALRESESRFRLLVDTMPAGLFVQVDGRIVYLNAQAVEHFGAAAPEELLGTHVLEHVHPEGRDAARARLAELSARRRRFPGHEVRFLRRDGGAFDVELTAEPIDFGGRPGALVFFRDVGHQKRLEAQFRQAQKMEALGTLAGGVAHDFNNLLTIIKSGASMLVDEALPLEEIHELSREILNASDRATGLTRQLLLFSRRQAMKHESLELGQVVANLAKMLSRIVGEDVSFAFEPQPDRSRIRGDVGMIEQVVLNLAVNARDAMPDGGRLTLRTGLVALDAVAASDLARIRTGSGSPIPGEVADREGTWVFLSVADTGTGIPPEVLPHIYEPFFTTKPQGKGTGLGLATVFGIVEQHGGIIAVDSSPGEGTRFTLYFPADTAAQTVAAPLGGVATRVRGSGTVLVVEDEAPVRKTVATILSRCGYTVHTAGSGPEALVVWAARRAEIDLVLTDVVMPDLLDGVALVERMRVDRPELKVLFMSGYAARADGRVSLVEGENFLPKPFNASTLAEAVHRRMESA